MPQVDCKMQPTLISYLQALAHLELALKLATSSFNLRVLRAECLACLGRLTEAEEAVGDLLRRDSNNLDVLFVQGLIHYYTDNTISHFERILNSATNHQKTINILKVFFSLSVA